MSIFVYDKIRNISSQLSLRQKYRSKIAHNVMGLGISVPDDTDTKYIEGIYEAIKDLPKSLLKDCGINKLDFEDLGPSAQYYPNHGKYRDSVLILNSNLFDDPPVGQDDENNDISHIKFVLVHEMGHGYDEISGKKDGGKDLSLRPEWLNLSGWSEKPIKGYKKLIIHEPGHPVVRGEWFYSPEAKFCRFYGKRNPWDDWADTFSFYNIGLKRYIPEKKIKYFDDILNKYYKE